MFEEWCRSQLTGNSIAWLEFMNIAACLMDDTGDIIARIHGYVVHKGILPVLGIRTRDDDFDDKLIVFGDGNGGVDDVEIEVGLDDGFLHGD